MVAGARDRAGTRALFAAMVLLALARLAAQLAPSMYAWSINFGRTAPTVLAVLAFVILAAGLLPAAGDRFASALEPRRAAAPPGTWLATVLAAAGIALVVLLHDRALFVGDALLRAGQLHEGDAFLRMFPQAMPLDRLLHGWIPQQAAVLGPWDPETLLRALGAAEAALLAWIAIRFADGLGARGALRVGIAGAVLFGGYLQLLTGYGKPTGEIAICTIAAGVFGLEVARERRGTLAFGLAVSCAMLLHRAGLPLLAAWLAVVVMWARDRRPGRGAWGALHLSLPLLTLAVLGPRLVHLLLGFDLHVNFASHEVEAQGGILRTAFSPLRLLDDANVLLLLAPLLPAALALAPGLRREDVERPEFTVLAALVAGSVPTLLFVYVTQGPFRDWDAFAGSGAAAALAAAWVIARVLARTVRPQRFGLALVTSALAPLVLLMASQCDLRLGIDRAHRFLEERPVRTSSQRLATLDYIGLACLTSERWAEAGAAYASLCEAAPHVRALILWGTSTAIAGDTRQAERAFGELTARAAAEPIGWMGLWMMAVANRDSAEAARADAVIRPWLRDGPEWRVLGAYFDHYPRMAALIPARTGSPAP
jgi:hypothetical protein